MLGFHSTAARCTWTAVLVLTLCGLVYQARFTLFVFVLALLFAHLLSPLVDLIDRLLPSSRTRTRTPALALAYIVFVTAVVLVGIQVGSAVVTQANALAVRFPAMIKDAITGWQSAHTGLESVDALQQQAMDGIQKALGEVVSALPAASMKIVAAASNLVYLVIIPILAFFFLKDAGAMRQHVVEMVDEGPGRALLEDVLSDIHRLLARYMRSLVVLSAAAFTAYAVFFSILGLPYGILLAAMGGVLEFIPMIGPLLSGLTIVAVTAISGGHVVAVVIFLLAYRVVQDYILSPHLMERGVAIHPLLVLFGVFAGAEIAGIAGSFLSVPVLAMVRILHLRIRKARREAHAAAQCSGV